MHGRVKVKTTEEQKEAKRKEREVKLKLYTAGTTAAFTKRDKGETDKELLAVTGEILAVNPDFYTLWNIRRQTLIALKEKWSDEEVSKTFNNELFFLEQCLQVNPKSYGTWHHRSWVLDNSPKADWKREIHLCNKFLEYDERNFHCWDYRRFVVKRAEISMEKELDFTTEKISTNFSNFSSWHYRSKLLPLIHPDPAHPVGVKEDVLLKEFELAQNAFFTDPSDQSAWFYHRWLLGKGQGTLSIRCVHVSRETSRILIVFTNSVMLGKSSSVALLLNQTEHAVQLMSLCAGSYSKLWVGTVDDNMLDDDTDMSLQLTQDDTVLSQCDFTLQSKQNVAIWTSQQKSHTLFRNVLTEATKSTLTQELDSCLQLHELEPDNKWTMLTIVSLMRALDPLLHHQQVSDYLRKLASIDPSRANYYKDLESKYQVENTLESLDPTSQHISLSNMGLSCLPHLDYMVTMETIDLSNNALSRPADWLMLQCVKCLDLSGNRLETCEGMEGMRNLEELSLLNNNIRSVKNVLCLGMCPLLRVLRLSGNPVCREENCRQETMTSIRSLQDLVL